MTLRFSYRRGREEVSCPLRNSSSKAAVRGQGGRHCQSMSQATPLSPPCGTGSRTPIPVTDREKAQSRKEGWIHGMWRDSPTLQSSKDKGHQPTLLRGQPAPKGGQEGHGLTLRHHPAGKKASLHQVGSKSSIRSFHVWHNSVSRRSSVKSDSQRAHKGLIQQGS